MAVKELYMSGQGCAYKLSSFSLCFFSGNGGNVDDCSADGYASSIYTFTVSGTSDSGQFPWYGEHCTSVLASTFSSGTSRQKKIISCLESTESLIIFS